jgi:hypothetical protein
MHEVAVAGPGIRELAHVKLLERRDVIQRDLPSDGFESRKLECHEAPEVSDPKVS